MESAAARIRDAVRKSMRLRTPDKPQHGAYHVDFRSMLTRIATITKHAEKSSPILLVGDDDLTSLVLHYLGFSDVTVIDFDSELLQTVKRASKDRIRTLSFDLRGIYRGKLPRLSARHALFVTDPPYGVDGLRVFAGVGLRALAPGGYGIVVCPSRRIDGSSVGDPLALGRSLQSFLIASGAVVTELIPDAQRSYHGTLSSLVVVQKIDARARVDFAVLAGPGSFY